MGAFKVTGNLIPRCLDKSGSAVAGLKRSEGKMKSKRILLATF